MTDVCQVDSDVGDVHFNVVNEDEEKNEADEGSDKNEEAKEETFAGADTINPCVCDHLPGSDAHTVGLLVTPVSETESWRLY